jgi:hypothetical protein
MHGAACPPMDPNCCVSDSMEHAAAASNAMRTEFSNATGIGVADDTGYRTFDTRA